VSLDALPGISLTALLTASARAREPALSGDAYAGAWVAPAAAAQVEALRRDYAREVCAGEDAGLAVRCRFFLDALREMAAAHPDLAYVGLGAGFTSYPLLTDRPVRAMEVDLAPVVALKRARLAELAAGGAAPHRTVDLCAADLARAADRARLRRTLARELGGRPSFVLLEGVSYYLPRAALDDLLDAVRGAQAPGSRLAFDYWGPDAEDHPVLRAMGRFYAARLGWHGGAYSLLETAEVASLAGYRPVRLTDAVAHEATLRASAHVPASMDGASSPPDPVRAADPATFVERFALLERA
jgi:O-methyltransferase involved in polyketide biosynthesis